VADFGDNGLWYHNGTNWNWMSNSTNVPEMTAWGNRLAVDFSPGVGVYNYNGAWNYMRTWSTAE